ncbi:MAG: phage Gp37/Gp68 family protein [Steroidobacteraceae bacterium]
MATRSAIEWTEMTWNPVTGCTKVSPGCANCYAERMTVRLRAMGAARYARGFELATHDDALDAPLRWKAPRKVFVNSMSDLFHKDVPIEFIRRVFAVMARCPQHQFQILTKRSARLRAIAAAGELEWPANVWMGVSVEDQRRARRAVDLAAVPAVVRFLSVEPLLGPIERLPLEGIHWVIVGGESGPRARPMDPAWVENILAQCRSAGVAFFFKQWGGVRKHRYGRMLGGRTYDEMPGMAGT